jgi:hypothetical protein
MNQRGRAKEYRLLCQCWHDWTEVIELFARKQPGRLRVHPDAYQALYTELLASCQALCRAVATEERGRYERLADVVRPWLDLHILEQTEKEILMDLLSRCVEIDQQLQGRRWLSLARALRKPLLFLLLAGLVGAGLYWSAEWTLLPLLKAGKVAWLRLLLAIKNATVNQWLVVGGFVVALVLMFVLSRSTRT